MGRMLKESFVNIKGESRAYKENRRKTKSGNAYAYSMINLEPDYQQGVIAVSKGFTKIMSLNTYANVDNIKIVKDNSGDYKFIAISNGNVYEISNWRSGTISKSLKHSGLNAGYTPIIPVTDRTSGTDYLVLLDGGYPHKFDFSTVTDLTTNHKASIGFFENDRLWTNDVEETGLIKWSAAGNPSDFTTSDNAGFLLMGNALNPITAMTTIFVPSDNQTHVVVAKQDEIWGISGNSGDSNEVSRFRSYSINEGEIGTRSPRGLTRAGQDVYILADDDIRPLSTLNEMGLVRPRDVSEDIRPIYREHVYKEELENAFLYFDNKDGKNGRVYSFVPTDNIAKNNKAFVYDLQGGWFRRHFNSFDFTCMCKDPYTGNIYAGDSFGNIYEFNAGYNYNGKSYKKFLDLGFVDFGDGNTTKTCGPNSYLSFEIINATSLKINTLVKNNNSLITNVEELSFDNYEYGYDEVAYGEAIYNYKREIKKELNIEHAFDELCLQISDNTLDSNFKIKELFLIAEQGAI